MNVRSSPSPSLAAWLLLLVLVLSGDGWNSGTASSVFAQACNRFYTSTNGGKVLTRLNRRNGSTKNIGMWQKRSGGDRIIDTLEWNFPDEKLFGFELREDMPSRSQRLVRINRQKPRGANINNVTMGLTDRFDLMGLAVSGLNVYYTHSLNNQTLYTIDETTGALTELFFTGLENVLDLAWKINTQEIWAVTGTQIFIIDPETQTIREFEQTFIERNPNNRLVAIGFNPVRHVPIVLTQGDSVSGALPTLYRFILANGTEVFQGTTSITDGSPAGGTIQCKRRVFSPAPSSGPTKSPAPTAPTNSPRPTKVPTTNPPSIVPSNTPTTTPALSHEMDPITMEFDSSNDVNIDAVEAAMADYLLENYRQEYGDNLEEVQLIREVVTISDPPAGGRRLEQEQQQRGGGAGAGAGRRRRLSEQQKRGLSKGLQVGQQRKAGQQMGTEVQHQQQRQLQQRFVIVWRVVIIFRTPTSIQLFVAQGIQQTALMEPQVVQNSVNTFLIAGGFLTIAVQAIVVAVPTERPSEAPSFLPTAEPSEAPSLEPTEAPSREPSEPPSHAPSISKAPSAAPTNPTPQPSSQPSKAPSPAPVAPIPNTTPQPSSQPSKAPSPAPFTEPSGEPSAAPV